MEDKNSLLKDVVSKAIEKMELFKESLRTFLAKQENDQITLTLDEMESLGINLPSTAIRIPNWWHNSSVRGPIWKEIGWKSKVTIIDGKLDTITFAKGPVAKDMPDIEEIVTEPLEEKILPDVQKEEEIGTKKRENFFIKNSYGLVSIIIGFFAFISPVNLFIYTAAVNICLVGILIGTFGTKNDKSPVLAYIGIIFCLLMLLFFIIAMNVFLIELAE